MEQAVKFKSDFETRETRRPMVDMTTFNSINFQRYFLFTLQKKNSFSVIEEK